MREKRDSLEKVAKERRKNHRTAIAKFEITSGRQVTGSIPIVLICCLNTSLTGPSTQLINSTTQQSRSECLVCCTSLCDPLQVVRWMRSSRTADSCFITFETRMAFLLLVVVGPQLDRM